MMKKLLIFTGVFLFMCMPSVAQSKIVQLTNNNYDDILPRINDSGQVVWIHEGLPQEVLLYNYSDGKTISIFQNFNLWNTADICYLTGAPGINNKGHVVWDAYSKFGTYEIYRYDCGTQKVSTISSSMKRYGVVDSFSWFWNPKVSDSGQVIWQLRWPPSDINDIQMWIGTDDYLAKSYDKYDNKDPQINNNGQVVWARFDGFDYEIWLYTGTEKLQITDNTYPDSNPQINDRGQVVWEGYGPITTDSEIFFYDGTQIHQLTNNSYDDYSPQINDRGQVVWVADDGISQVIFLYDGTQTYRLTYTEIAEDDPRINDSGQVVWEGYDGTDTEIFVYDGTTTTQLTNNDYGDVFPQINDSGQAVWYGYDGTDWEIYLYTPEAPTPDIKANGSDEPVILTQSDTLSITGQLDAGGMGSMNADWWVVVQTPLPAPADWFYFDFGSGWQPWMPQMPVTYQGPLFDLSPFEIFKYSGLPVGIYAVYFGVDMDMNGVLDMDRLYYDSVMIVINP